MMSGGGVCLSLDPPTNEQKEAEVSARNILFGSKLSLMDISSQLNKKYDRDEEELRNSLFPQKSQSGMLAFNSLSEEYKHPQMKEFHQKRENDIRNRLVFEMLQSPMFTNLDGFTAMNDALDICTGAECTSNALQSTTGQTNPDESSLDDFFPQPLQPFSF